MSAEAGGVHVEVLPDHEQAGHGSRRGYITGFVLSVLLTAIPFWLVMGHVFDNSQLAAFLIMSLAIAQIVVHMVYFLHMNTRSEGGWTVLALIFTLVLVSIAIGGSLWIMFHLDSNMQVMTIHDMGSMP